MFGKTVILLYKSDRYGQIVSIEDTSSLLGLGLLEVKTRPQTNNISLGSIGRNKQTNSFICATNKILKTWKTY